MAMSVETAPEASPVIVWFRDDQRLADNPALAAAIATRHPLICVFVFDEASEGIRPLGGAARWWLHGSLAELDRGLAALGGRLVIFRGPGDDLISSLAAETEAAGVYWNRRYDEAGRNVDDRLKSTLTARGVTVESFNGGLLYEPWTVMSKSGTPFRVFTPFWRAARQLGDPPLPVAAPKKASFHAVAREIEERSVTLDMLALEPTAPDWAEGLRQTWKRGEAGAQEQLRAFARTGLAGYSVNRDRPDLPSTSRLSPYLRFGNISPRQVWHAVVGAVAAGGGRPEGDPDLDKYLAEVGWREFCYHLLYHHPDLATRNFQPSFDGMPWREDPKALRAWQRGETGYPIVDAGMHELWRTGWMHNRARMIVASFLVKHLLMDWREGEAWFWETLVDADPANNPASWQWVAGSGADAAPYFRVFNPILQGEKFDPDGDYVRHWVPRLSALPASVIHKPWTAKVPVEGYPSPIIAHKAGRERALEAFRTIRESAGPGAGKGG